MDAASIPSYKFATPWAADATTGYLTATIPATAASPAASQELGFPPATAAPIASGGTPPNIADFNGFGNYVTAWLQWVQAGGAPVVYDATFQTAIGGYPNGAIVQSALHAGRQWISSADNNTSDPDTGGANWTQLGASGIQILAAGASGNFTVPAYVFTLDSEIWGGGGGSGAVASVGASGGGAGGGYSRKSISVTPGQIIPYSVGSGGSAGAGSGPTNGGNGGTTSVGSGPYHSATGGMGGAAGNGAGGAGGLSVGAGSGGDENYDGEVGGGGVPSATVGPWGGDGGGAFKSPGGPSGGVNASPATPSFPGAGGRGTATTNNTAYNGAPGGGGQIIFRWKVGQ